VIGIIIDKLPNATDGQDLEAVPSITHPHNLSPRSINMCCAGSVSTVMTIFRSA
jgi:hypothetical protein